MRSFVPFLTRLAAATVVALAAVLVSVVPADAADAPPPPAPVPSAPAVAAPAPPAPPARPVVSPTPCAVAAKACMDLSTRQAWLTDGAGHIVYGPVAARGGSSSAPTPTGTFRVLSQVRHYHSREFDAPMPYSTFFYPGDAFHADNPRSASNGCIHLTSASAEKFFDTLNKGDEVQVVS